MTSTHDLRIEVTRRLDDLEANLPGVPSKAIAFGRATTHRAVDTVTSVATDLGRQLGNLSSTASSAFATTTGQARSAAERTAATARTTAKETVGQAKAQTTRTASATVGSTEALLDDATRAVEPDGNGRSGAYEQWTKDELYERARELDVDGRSGMSKRQLIAALRSS